MREQELRELVRDAIERHLGPRARWSVCCPPVPEHPHPSHVLVGVRSGSAVGDGTCLIEPAARCSQCDHCRSYGY